MTQRNDLQTADHPHCSTDFAATSNNQSAGVNVADAPGSRHASGHRSRRNVRIAVSLPVIMRDQFGTSEEVRTQFVMVRGAVLATKSNLRVGHKLTIQILKSSKTAECHVIALEPALKDLHHVEVEFTRAQPDFWPVQFPAEDHLADSFTGLGRERPDRHDPLLETPSSAGNGDAGFDEVEGLKISGFERQESPSSAHDDKIVVLADSSAQLFEQAQTFRVPERVGSRTAAVDSVAQFRAANRAAHRRERRMKAFYSVLSIATLGAAILGGKAWMGRHPEGLQVSMPHVLKSSKPAQATSPVQASDTSLGAPVVVAATPHASQIDANPIQTTASAELVTPSVAEVPPETRPAETQVFVRHNSSSSLSRKKAPEADEEPIALPLRVSDSALLGAKPAMLSAVVGEAPAKTAVLAPQVPKRVVPARLIHSVPAQYPPMARQIRLEGEVVLSLEIDSTGTVSSAKAISGAPMLRAAALDAARRWKYQPAILGDKPVASSETVRLSFSLR